MNISIASYSVHGLLAEGKIDVFGYLESCKYRYGLDTADFWNGLIGTTDAGVIRKVRQAVEERELTVVNYHVDGCHLWEDDPDTREKHYQTALQHLQIAAQLGAQAFLLRPGGLNPAGPWTPHRDNHRPENTPILVETLLPIARKAEQEGVLLAMETHAVSVMDPPEKCRAIIEAIGSNHLRLIMDAVNHFQCLQQVYHSSDWVNHIFDVMGPLAPLAHLKDLKLANGLVLHIDQEVPGEGQLDLALVLRRFEALHPAGYGLIEHLTPAQIPLAVANIRRLAAENGVVIY